MSTFQKVQKMCLRPRVPRLMSLPPWRRRRHQCGEEHLKEHDPLRRKYSSDMSPSPLINTRLLFLSLLFFLILKAEERAEEKGG